LRSAVAVIMAILGTVLVLGGAAALWASALTRPQTETPDAGGSASRSERVIDTLSRVRTPDRLILWGVVLLALSAVASGAIQIAASASAGNQ
jgi:hypothetical protein